MHAAAAAQLVVAPRGHAGPRRGREASAGLGVAVGGTVNRVRSVQASAALGLAAGLAAARLADHRPSPSLEIRVKAEGVPRRGIAAPRPGHPAGGGHRGGGR